MENNQQQAKPIFKQHKTAWKIIGVLALVLIILLVWQSTKNKKATEEMPLVNENIEVQNVPTSELPSAIPNNIPLEENALIIENDIITAPDKPGITQYTRKFVSNKSPEENYAIYKDFLNANNWEVVSVTDEDTLKSLIAVSPDKTEQLFITVSENTISGEVTVDLTVIVQE